MRNRRSLLATFLALSLAACSYSYAYDYDVTIADEVELTEGAQVVMASSESSGDIADASVDVTEDLSPAERSYSGEAATCCAPDVTINFFAFIDLDASGEWEPGEPWGADPGNPVTIRNEGYEARIVIENDANG